MSNARKLRLGVLGSGRGSNLESILAAAEADPEFPAEVAIVISDLPGAPILERAGRRGIETAVVEAAGPRGRLGDEAEDRIASLLRERSVELVVLAGFMRVLRGRLLTGFAGRIVNIHPSLLPSFPGLESWKQALEYGARITGCTVHFVDSGVDTGPIIGQRAVPVLEDDTPESLHGRIQEQEHELYPESIRRIALGQAHVAGRRVVESPPDA